jgi:hypothetical protein
MCLMSTDIRDNPPYQEKPQTRSHERIKIWCVKEEQLVTLKRPLWELGTLTHTHTHIVVGHATMYQHH